jgi:hypothetical protein
MSTIIRLAPDGSLFRIHAAGYSARNATMGSRPVARRAGM